MTPIETTYEHYEIPKPQRKLLPMFERVEPKVLSHSQMDEWKKCPRKYFLSTVLGYKPKQTPPYFAFGGAYHKFRESLDKLYKESGDYLDQDLFKQSLQIAISYFNKKLPKGPPPGRWEFMDVGRLAVSCKRAYEYWLEERKRGEIKILNIEIPWNIQYAGKNRTNGRIDNIIEWKGSLWIRDYKTSSQPRQYFERNTEPNDQVSRYIKALSSLSGETVRGVVFEVLFNDARKGPEIYQVLSSRTKTQLENWEKDQEFLHAMIDAARESDIYPMFEPSCTFCDYHFVCKAPHADAMASELRRGYKFEPYDNMAENDD